MPNKIRTQEESDRLPFSDSEKNRLFMTLDLHTKQNEKIERALYGDKDNGVKGLMERTTTIESWILNSKAKISFFSGMGVVIGFLAMKTWEWIVKK